MRLYLVERTDHVEYEEMRAALVRAECMYDARQRVFSDVDRAVVTVKRIREDGEPGVVFADYER